MINRGGKMCFLFIAVHQPVISCLALTDTPSMRCLVSYDVTRALGCFYDEYQYLKQGGKISNASKLYEWNDFC